MALINRQAFTLLKARGSLDKALGLLNETRRGGGQLIVMDRPSSGVRTVSKRAEKTA
ncbi:hypothetical protein [Paraburkholderia sp. BL25I1N1]|uniref:hypothetical protein n=1 Tax=Paraburkholderia sp. BL25I1N1 TaxID=1938804 RepID=UPI000D40B05A|nr:hypothetical protein [Paraburkholderia sp. BL25I1N1]PRY04231.1 hypothetical protein B0G73_113220 [Paraburkholderia sp. BL25I1N1]